MYQDDLIDDDDDCEEEVHYLNISSPDASPADVKRISGVCAQVLAERGLEACFDKEHGLGIVLPKSVSSKEVCALFKEVMGEALSRDGISPDDSEEPEWSSDV
jgi:hypothetical protein